MATQTTNYGLKKPDYNSSADIGVINSNMDIIDAKMKEIEDKAGSGGGTSITVDSELSDTSTNPVQNKVITAKLQNQINVDYNNKIRIVTSDTKTGSFTAPRNGVAYCDLYVENGYLNVHLNNVLVACYSTSSKGDLVTPVIMHKGDVLTWDTTSDVAYMRGDIADRSIFV